MALCLVGSTEDVISVFVSISGKFFLKRTNHENTLRKILYRPAKVPRRICSPSCGTPPCPCSSPSPAGSPRGTSAPDGGPLPRPRRWLSPALAWPGRGGAAGGGISFPKLRNSHLTRYALLVCHVYFPSKFPAFFRTSADQPRPPAGTLGLWSPLTLGAGRQQQQH